MAIIKVMNVWFAYAADRVLGPFKFERQARAALQQHDVELRDGS